MIKRRFYREEHGDKDDPSSDSSSSSSSDSEVEAEAAVESEEDRGVEARDGEEPGSMSSGYESEDSSVREIDAGSSGDETEQSVRPISRNHDAKISNEELGKTNDEESLSADLPDCVLKCKSVYKCRICPRIVCLNEETMKLHLNSKRHARSEKLLNENRLKVMLNSDCEIENQETAAELHARIVALSQELPKKKNKGRQRQKKRQRKNRTGDDSTKEKVKGSSNGSARKKHKKDK